jgi:acetyl esterase
MTGAQSTMDLDWWLENIPEYDRVHVDPSGYFQADPSSLDAAVREASIINHITWDDPPVYMSYRMAPDEAVPEKNANGWKIHHVNFGIALLKALNAVGVEATLDYPGPATRYDSAVEFLIDKLANEYLKNMQLVR